jgi:hypothetical protein
MYGFDFIILYCGAAFGYSLLLVHPTEVFAFREVEGCRLSDGAQKYFFAILNQCDLAVGFLCNVKAGLAECTIGYSILMSVV